MSAGGSGSRFAWLPGSVGDWLVPLHEGTHSAPDPGRPVDALAAIVPAGFPALIRVLSPFRRVRPEDQRAEAVSWAATAEALGTTLDPVPLSWRVMGASEYGGNSDVLGEDGWYYSEPTEGQNDPDTLARIAGVLALHTSTPDQGVAAVWEGFSGLTSSQGVGFFFATATLRPVSRLQHRLLSAREHLRRFGIRSAVLELVAPSLPKPRGTGILGREAVSGQRLELPDRRYICFSAGVASFAEETWPARAPWVDSHGPDSGNPLTPNLIWPDDRAWVLVSEIDLNSTLIACSRECADALLSAPGLEASEITRGTRLWG